jgi:hypothetical protein
LPWQETANRPGGWAPTIRHGFKEEKKASAGPLPDGQRGAALLLSVLLLLIGGVGLLLGARPENAHRLRDERAITAAMQSAKAELIGYAVGYDRLYSGSRTGPGHLPCPDADGDGSPDTPCGPNALGRLPRTAPSAAERIWLGDHGAGTGRQFWYAVADRFRNNPPEQKVNSNTGGPLAVDGVGGAIAVLIEPGGAGAGQSRPSNQHADYLEGADPAAGSYLTAGGDRVLAIHAREVVPLINARVAAEVVPLLRRYRADCGYYPAPVLFANPAAVTSFDSDVSGAVFEGLFPAGTAYPTDWGTGCAPALNLPEWVVANRWLDHVYYAVAPSDPCTPGIDCLTLSGGPLPDNGRQALLLFPGIALPGQGRSGPGVDRGDYFERGNAIAMDGVFETGRLDATFNDQAFVVN